MRSYWVFGPLLVSILGLTGCGKSPAGTAKADATTVGPDKAVTVFLEAVRTGNDGVMLGLLTEAARLGLEKNGMTPQKPSSDDATFEVTEFEYVDGGAHVACNWIEKTPDGSVQKTPVIWMVRKEPSGWRIAGMAQRVFDDIVPVILNFEDPEDMIQKQELIEQEIARREQAEVAEETPAGSATTKRK